MDDELQNLRQQMKRDFSDNDDFSRYLAGSRRAGLIKEVPTEIRTHLDAWHRSLSDLLCKRVVEIANEVFQPFPEMIFVNDPVGADRPEFQIRSGMPYHTATKMFVIEPQGVHSYGWTEVPDELIRTYRNGHGMYNPPPSVTLGRIVHAIPIHSQRQNPLITIDDAQSMLRVIDEWILMREKIKDQPGYSPHFHPLLNVARF